MTLPDERYRALVNTRNFLRSLLDPAQTPKVPKEIRKRAYVCLKHYPWDTDMDELALQSPSILSMEDK